MAFPLHLIAIFLGALLVVAHAAPLSDAPATCTRLHPVVIVPGTGGNQLLARLDKPSVPHFFCDKKFDWFRLWLSTQSLLPGAIDCWADNIRLVYNETTDTLENSPGVETKIPDFGGTSAVEALDPSLASVTKYFSTFVDAMVAKGYVRGKSIRAAPYDFRKAPSGDAEYLGSLRKLIEETREMNDNATVVVIAHSMGNLQAIGLFDSVSEEWKKENVKGLVSAAPAYAGSVNALLAIVAGNNEGIPFVAGKTVRPQQRTYESNYWLLPNPAAFGADDAIVSTASRTFSTADFAGLFEDMKFDLGTQMLRRVSALSTHALSYPGVPIRAVYGFDVKTPRSFSFKGTGASAYDEAPDVVESTGDGTVPIESLRVWQRWTAAAQQKGLALDAVELSGVNHAGVVERAEVVDAVMSFACEN